MPEPSLKTYLESAIAGGATAAVEIHPDSVVTAQWVRWKCLYGCSYNHSWVCPPNSPSPEETRSVLDSYRRAILLHFAVPKLEPDAADTYRAYYLNIHKKVVDLENTIFKDGYYKAFSFLFGGCMICAQCASVKDEPCRFRQRIRPPMEASGIDVFQTVRNNGFDIRTLKVRGEVRNQFCLILVD